MEAWGGIELDQVAANGNLTQLYPLYAAAGAALPAANLATIRKPQGGRVGNASIQTDAVSGGYVEIWDINGIVAGADVSSLTVITNAQLVAMEALGWAKLLWSQNFAATPSAPAPWSLSFGFMKGLAARYVQATGGAKCWLNLSVEGGFSYQVVRN